MCPAWHHARQGKALPCDAHSRPLTPTHAHSRPLTPSTPPPPLSSPPGCQFYIYSPAGLRLPLLLTTTSLLLLVYYYFFFCTAVRFTSSRPVLPSAPGEPSQHARLHLRRSDAHQVHAVLKAVMHQLVHRLQGPQSHGRLAVETHTDRDT